MLTQDDLNAIQKIVKGSEKKLLDRMLKDKNWIVDYFDDKYFILKTRVEYIEHKLGIASAN